MILFCPLLRMCIYKVLRGLGDLPASIKLFYLFYSRKTLDVFYFPCVVVLVYQETKLVVIEVISWGRQEVII